MLRGLQIVAITMLVWGSLASASLPSVNDAGKDLQTIASWMAHLNHYYGDLDVSVPKSTNLANPKVRLQLMQELGKLEDMMGNGTVLPASSLQQIACGRPQCNGGGGGGKCSTCSVDGN